MRTRRWVAAAVVLAGAGWAAGRMARGPARVDVRAFDPDAVARLETDMWRSYYDRRRLLLVALLRGQFRLSVARSVAVALLAARAAAVFQVGRDRADYELALPYLERYYAAILAVSQVRFDAARAARLELDWWVLHRDAAGHPSAELERALAALAAELYQVPAGRLEVRARRRAEAMTVRDRRAGEPGGVTDADWERIAAILRLAWRSLATEVKGLEPSG
jgi:hypothetical protein